MVVPSQSLREQSADKFLRLGLLHELGIIPEGTPLPLVGVITKRAEIPRRPRTFSITAMSWLARCPHWAKVKQAHSSRQSLTV